MKRSSIVYAALAALVFFGGLLSIGNMVEWVEPQEYVRIQFPNGGFKWVTTPGPTLQAFGNVVRYTQRGTITFKAEKDNEGNIIPATDARLPMVFNDGGKGWIEGSINYELPPDVSKLNEIHRYYPEQQALEASLIKPALNKSVYLTGTLMTSYESYKERRSQLVQYVDDTVQNGVYQTDSKDVNVPDDLDPTKMKRVTVVEIQRIPQGQPGAGQPRRVDQGQLNRFGIRTFNFAIVDLDYEQAVDDQIKGQQKITMQVQTAIAEAKQADQKKITTEAEGAADAAKAKWMQETIKAQKVVEAQQKLEVATLDNQSAEQERQAILKRASGEAEGRKLLMAADGALTQKLKAYVDVNHGYAAAIQNYKGAWVPTIQTGGSTGSGAGSETNNAALTFFNLINMKTAKELGLDVTPGAR